MEYYEPVACWQGGGHAPSVKIFRGCEKLEKGAKTALLMMQNAVCQEKFRIWKN